MKEKLSLIRTQLPVFMPAQTQKSAILLILCSALISSFGQMFYKLYYTGGLGYLVIGLLLYLLGGLFMMAAFRRGKLSVIQPMLALSNVFAIAIAVAALGETITPLRLFGIALIIGGTILIGGESD